MRLNVRLDNEEIIFELCKSRNGKIDWNLISYEIVLPIEFIRKYKDKLHWKYFTSKYISTTFDSLCSDKERENLIKEFQDYVNWNDLDSYFNDIQFSEEFIEEFTAKNKLSLDKIPHSQKLSESFIRKHKDIIDWHSIIYYQQHISEDFIREMIDYIDVKDLSHRKHMSDEFINEFKDQLDWDEVCQFSELSEKTIEKYEKYIVWSFWFSQNQVLSEDFMRKYKDKLHWDYLSCSQKMSEDFIREFKDRVNITRRLGMQPLSEDFLEEFHDKFNWTKVASCQKLSTDCIRRHEKEIFIGDHIMFDDDSILPIELIRKYKNNLNWVGISTNHNLTEDFVEEFKNNIYWDTLISSNKYVSLSTEFLMKMKKYIPLSCLLEVKSFYKLYDIFKDDKNVIKILNKKIDYKYLKCRDDNNRIARECYHYFKDRKLSLKEMIDEFIERGIDESTNVLNRPDIKEGVSLFFIRDIYEMVSKKMKIDLPIYKTEDNKETTTVYVVVNKINNVFLSVCLSLDNAKKALNKYKSKNCDPIIIEKEIE